jgi:tRNA pseudouridine38-40 synthase
MTRAFEISYDGTRYAGWQIQDNAETVQGIIENKLAIILKKGVRITYAGRTDAGVHAIGQVIAFDTQSGMMGDQFKKALNALLPQDIRVMRELNVSPDFHPRYSARNRWYRYIIWNGREQVPFFRNYALWLVHDVDITRIRDYGERITGTHDFTSLATLEAGENPVRTVQECSVYRKNDFVIIDIVANSFLRKMVRTIVGTFLKLEREGKKPEEMDRILAAKRGDWERETAYAGGLYLARVFY